jgi:hypothetical protein
MKKCVLYNAITVEEFELKKGNQQRHEYLTFCYSQTGVYIVVNRNFVCLWRRQNCRSQVFGLSLSVLISCFITINLH